MAGLDAAIVDPSFLQPCRILKEYPSPLIPRQPSKIPCMSGCLRREDPLYVGLFEKTKSKAWGPSGFGPNDEKNFEELKKLHETEVENYDEGSLIVKDAYAKNV